MKQKNFIAPKNGAEGRVTKYASIPENSYDDIGSVSPYGAIYQVL